MTSKEFVFWLQGFLDASDDLKVEGVNFILGKIKEIKDDLTDYVDIQPIPYQYNDYKYLNPCPAGGQHEYPDIWHGTIPPPCKKCGYSEPQVIFTYSDIVGPMCEVDPNRPCTVNNCCKDTWTFQIPADAKPGDVFEVRGPEIKCFQGGLGEGMSYIEFNVPLTEREIIYGEDTFNFKIPTEPFFNTEEYTGQCCNQQSCCMSGGPFLYTEPKPWPSEIFEINLDGSEWCESSQKYIEFEVELTDEDRAIIGTNKRYARFKIPIKPVPEELKRYGRGEYMFDFKTRDGQESYRRLMERKIKEASENKAIKIMP